MKRQRCARNWYIRKRRAIKRKKQKKKGKVVIIYRVPFSLSHRCTALRGFQRIDVLRSIARFTKSSSRKRFPKFSHRIYSGGMVVRPAGDCQPFRVVKTKQTARRVFYVYFFACLIHCRYQTRHRIVLCSCTVKRGDGCVHATAGTCSPGRWRGASRPMSSPPPPAVVQVERRSRRRW